MLNSKTLLIAVSIQSIQIEPYFYGGRQAQSANIIGESNDRNSRFSIKTGLLNDNQLRGCELLKKHGTTIVESTIGYRGDNSWIDAAINQAIKRMVELYEGKEWPESMERYDPEFAREVLAKVNEHFPTPVESFELKRMFSNEPSDEKLLISLDGLQCDGYIEGHPMYEHTTGQRKLAIMARIKMTSKGRQYLSHAESNAHSNGPTVFHGDQYVNYGQAGAIGPNSVGTLNFHQQWNEIQNQVDFSALTTELEKLRLHLQKSAKSGDDYHQLAILANAEEHATNREGTKTMEVLSIIGKGALGVAKEIGTDIAAKVIAKSMGLEP